MKNVFYSKFFKTTKKGTFVERKEIKQDLGVEILYKGSTYTIEVNPYTNSLELKINNPNGLILRVEALNKITIKDKCE